MAALPELVSPVIAAIDAAWERRAEAEDRGDGWRLAVGALGEPCDRRSWYGFRWSHEREKFKGRMLRLFDVGHREENALIESLRLGGMVVSDRNPATRKQWEILMAMGHLRGKADGIVENVPGAPVVRHLLEVKTHNDKNFQQLKKHKDINVSHPKHWVQCQLGMAGLGLTRALYLAKNKNDDELYVERVHYDEAAVLRLVAKAERIVASPSPPPRISEDPDSYQCRFCPAVRMCNAHFKDPNEPLPWARVNCRTCLYSTPVDGGKWECGLLDKFLTVEEQKTGCAAHLYIPGLVPGEQVDTDEQKNTVTYLLHSGMEYVDGLEDKRITAGT